MGDYDINDVDTIVALLTLVERWVGLVIIVFFVLFLAYYVAAERAEARGTQCFIDAALFPRRGSSLSAPLPVDVLSPNAETLAPSGNTGDGAR